MGPRERRAQLIEQCRTLLGKDAPISDLASLLRAAFSKTEFSNDDGDLRIRTSSQDLVLQRTGEDEFLLRAGKANYGSRKKLTLSEAVDEIALLARPDSNN